MSTEAFGAAFAQAETHVASALGGSGGAVSAVASLLELPSVPVSAWGLVSDWALASFVVVPESVVFVGSAEVPQPAKRIARANPTSGNPRANARTFMPHTLASAAACAVAPMDDVRDHVNR